MLTIEPAHATKAADCSLQTETSTRTHQTIIINLKSYSFIKKIIKKRGNIKKLKNFYNFIHITVKQLNSLYIMINCFNPFLTGSASDDDLPRRFGLSYQERVN